MSLEITKHLSPTRPSNSGGSSSANAIRRLHSPVSQLSVSAASTAATATLGSSLQQQPPATVGGLLAEPTSGDSLSLELLEPLEPPQAEATGEINLPLLATAND
ncbi:MAG: hypothetical protein ABI954_06120, partial [Pyrinomonadaceae bacterium]